MEEMKKLTIPEDYEFDRVENGEVILKKKEVESVLPKMWAVCTKVIPTSYYPSINWYLPSKHDAALKALCKLLICRNAWWKKLGWKPDWNENSEKHCIGCNKYVVVGAKSIFANYILAFPTDEVRDQFIEAFKDLIEEAKELL